MQSSWNWRNRVMARIGFVRPLPVMLLCRRRIPRIQCRTGIVGVIVCSADRTFTLTTDFSNTLSKSQIEEMATVDEFEVVKEVQASPILQLAVERCIAQVSWIPNLGGY